ncbi:MAG: DUF2752 domain-containing protein [Nostocoides sp.]
MSPSNSTDLSVFRVVPAGPPGGGHRTEPATLARRLMGPGTVGLAAAGLATALALRDPHVSGSWGYCPFLLLTGHPCPGCGGLRATNDLLHGELTAALSSNAYAVLSIAALAVLWTAWVVRRVRSTTSALSLVSGRLGLWWLAGLLAFGALRLLPGLSVLQP